MFARGGFSVAGPVLLVLAVTFSQIPPPQSLRAQPLRGKVAATDNDDAPFLLALWRQLCASPTSGRRSRAPQRSHGRLPTLERAREPRYDLTTLQ
jgi:hypothetical protein